MRLAAEERENPIRVAPGQTGLVARSALESRALAGRAKGRIVDERGEPIARVRVARVEAVQSEAPNADEIVIATE